MSSRALVTRTVLDAAGGRVVRVVIAATCPRCGGRRGDPATVTLGNASRGRHTFDTWRNPCGHIDHYARVIAEAHALQSL